MAGNITNSWVSRPFVLAAVVLAFFGSAAGALWMMSLFGANIVDPRFFLLHRVLQVDGFLTMLIMGIGYMIVPRFRNTILPSTKLAYISFLLVAASVALDVASNDLQAAVYITHLAGVSIFAAIIVWMLRIRPKLLGLSDYFTGLAVATLVALAILHAEGRTLGDNLATAQAWLLFPIIMIFGIEYKTIPSFLGFIRPKKRLGEVSLALAFVSTALGISSAVYEIDMLAISFSLALLGCSITFALSLFIFGGFDNREILRLITGEKKARYVYTALYTRLSFAFLYAAIVMAAIFRVFGTYLTYDLAIHFAAIGFIGTTISLYLPLMLPPITGKAVHFARFNHAPIQLIVSALAIRTAGDAAISEGTVQPPLSYIFMTSGWLVVAALAVFVAMIYRSTKPAGPQDVAVV